MTVAHTYGTDTSEFQAGDRVELHPALDAWVSGDRFGTVLPSRSKTIVMVRLDRSGRKRAFNPASLRIVEG